jgi:hypothetical protein
MLRARALSLRSPSPTACSMRRALVPSRSDTTLDTVICASSRSDSSRLWSCTRRSCDLILQDQLRERPRIPEAEEMEIPRVVLPPLTVCTEGQHTPPRSGTRPADSAFE